ncbi:hypothetical protein EGW08_018777 [Elysia chlorotica]|uniref:G-protein coupled receptors family 1 profile domain-containing protein n=1 Tax=Elysia chlorotica TaxID=188477 RepID=A0A3S1B2J0_ELYCH|nr:hypothetical protein EGW08_018777 [Elysia chlorotica]
MADLLVSNSSSNDSSYNRLWRLLDLGGDPLLTSTISLHSYQERNEEYFRLAWLSKHIQRYYLMVLAAIGVPSNVLTVATILSMHALSPATFFVALLAVFDGCALSVKLLGRQLEQNKVIHALLLGVAAALIVTLVLKSRGQTPANLPPFPGRRVPIFGHLLMLGSEAREKLLEIRKTYISAVTLIGSLFALIMTTLGVTRTYDNGDCVVSRRLLWFHQNVWLYLNLALHVFIPFTCTALLTLFIIHGLRKGRQHRLSLVRKTHASGEKMRALQDGASDKCRSSSTPITPTSVHNQRLLDDTARVERTITLMLITAGLVFLLLSLPMALYCMVQGFSTRSEQSVTAARWVPYKIVAYLLIDTTHAINFFLYFMTAKRFRVQLLRVVMGHAACWTARRRHGPNQEHGEAASAANTRLRRRAGSKSAASHSTGSACLSSSGSRGSFVYLPSGWA